MFELIFGIWYIIVMVQSFLAIGTAYRLTKKGGDNGIALWGWCVLMGFAAIIPGLGIFLWIKNKE